MNAHDHRLSTIDAIAAVVSIVYLHASFLIALWFLFDTWIGGHTLPTAFGYSAQRLQSADYLTVVSAIVGGSIGGVINGLRSALHYSRTFDHRYLWKYMAAPWMGAALSLLAYALMTTTAAVLGGDIAGNAAVQTQATATPQLLSNFAIGALAGYGSKDAFIWLDAQVHKLFAVEQPVPDVQGTQEAVALSRIEAGNLAVGAVAAVPASSVPAGTVVAQAPAPGTPASRGDTVDITVAVEPDAALAKSAHAAAPDARPHQAATLLTPAPAVAAAIAEGQ